jgi:hypothetical protein
MEADGEVMEEEEIASTCSENSFTGLVERALELTKNFKIIMVGRKGSPVAFVV